MKASSVIGLMIGCFAMVIAGPLLRGAEPTGSARPWPRFSHPREITNPYLPLAKLKQDILEGKEDGKGVRVERTAKPAVRKSFEVGGQTVETLAVEDREFEDAQIVEVTLDYFAQADDGAAYYLGEDVDEYKDGKIVGHGGAWLFGAQTQKLGMVMPAHPKVGDKFRPEDVPGITVEEDEIVSLTELVKTPAGTFEKCAKVKEKLSDGETEYKYYAPGVGVVREASKRGELLLKSHSAVTQTSGGSSASVSGAAAAPAEDELARVSLSLVGADPVAEAYWLAAINDRSLPDEERSNLIEDLNEDGLSDPKHPAPEDLPLILNRLGLIEEVAPSAMDKVNWDAFLEAYKDLLNLAKLAQGRGQPVQ